MQYDLDINDIDSVQFVNHYMNTEQDMHILTDDKFESKLEELLDFVFGPKTYKFILFVYQTGEDWVYDTLEEALDIADKLQYIRPIKLGYQQRKYTNEIVVGIVFKEEYSLC
jgi:hypothetical protein